MKKRSHIYRGVTGIFVALFVMLQIIASVAGTWAGRVNELLEISGGGELERSANREDYQFLSDYETPAELIDAEIGLNTRLAAEGAVTLKGIPQIEGKGRFLVWDEKRKKNAVRGFYGRIDSGTECGNAVRGYGGERIFRESIPDRILSEDGKGLCTSESQRRKCGKQLRGSGEHNRRGAGAGIQECGIGWV